MPKGDLKMPALPSPSRRTAAVCAAAGLALAAAAPAHAAFPGRNGLLAVVVGSHASGVRPSIVLIGLDGKVVRRIRHVARAGDRWPSWSPDGRRLAFEAAVSRSSTRVAIVDSHGRHRRTLPSPAAGVDAVAPVWSPKGRRVAFGVVGAGARGIWSMGSVKLHVHRIADTGGLPSWSAHHGVTFGDSKGVWRVRYNGAGLTRVVGAGASDPDWSPRGSHIVYTRTRKGSQTIWTVREDGKGRRRLARGSMPAWSPDGGSIAFTRNGRIWVVNATGGTPRQVPFAPKTAAGKPIPVVMPAWQPKR